MIETVCLTLMTLFMESAAQYYYCPTPRGYNYKGQYAAIGPPNYRIYVSDDYPLLLNSSVPVRDTHPPALCVKRTNQGTGEIATLGCIDATMDSSHELIDILGYYMILLTDHDYVSEQYTWWIKGSTVADSVIEKLYSKWKISTGRQRPTMVIHQFNRHAKDVAVKFEDSSTYIAIAWLENGIAYKCHMFNTSFRHVLFLTANASYLSLTLSREFTLYGNYRVQVTNTNDYVSNHSMEVVQYVEDSSDHKTNTPIVIGIVVSVLVLVLVLSIIALVLRRKAWPKCEKRTSDNDYPQSDGYKIDKEGKIAEEGNKASEKVAADESKGNVKFIHRDPPTDKSVESDEIDPLLSPRQRSLLMRAKFFDLQGPNTADPSATEKIPMEQLEDFGTKEMDNCNILVDKSCKLNDDIDLLNQLFYTLDDNLTKDDKCRMVNIFIDKQISKRDAEKLDTSYDVFVHLRDKGHVTKDNLEVLKDLFQLMKRPKLVEDINKYCKKIRTVIS